MNSPNYVEVKPKTKQNAIVLFILCFAFSVIGFFLILSGEIINVLTGFLSIVFFGGGGLFAIPKLLQRPITMILNHDGIKQITPAGTSLIGWQDIESIGIARIYGNKMVGLRLITYDNYIKSMSPELIDCFIKRMPHLKSVAFCAFLLDVPNSIKLWSVLGNRPNPMEALRSFGKVGNLVEALLWNRKNFGYDICLAWSELDRPASEFIALLEQFHKAYTI